MRDFDGSQLLYRLAYASGKRAAQRANQSAQRGADAERRARAFDACVEAVVLAQASAEAWIHRLFEVNGVQRRGHGWLGHWHGIGHVAQALGLPMRSIRRETLAILEEVSAIRNYLLHGDQTSRQRLDAMSDGRDLHDLLTVSWVEQMFQRMEALWTEARDITGQSTPFTDHAWIALDEFI